MITGGCLCGSVRCRADGEPLARGGLSLPQLPAAGRLRLLIVVVGVKADSLIVEGDPKLYVDHGESGAQVNRYFCSGCGSPIYSELPNSPAVIYLKAGTLDETSNVRPKVHVWCDSAWPWTVIPDGAIAIPRNPA